jgi:predicted ATPase
VVGERMTETENAADRMFSLWLASLDGVALAERESFHSRAHRGAMKVHRRQQRIAARDITPRMLREKRERDNEQLGAIQFARFQQKHNKLGEKNGY